MTLTELKAKMPELKTPIEAFLYSHNIPFVSPIFGAATIDEANAKKAIQVYYAELEVEKKEEERTLRRKEAEEQLAQEQQRIAQEEATKKKRAMAKMLITSGFNFDGYRITKYSGYISGDDAMTVNRGSSFTDGGVRDKLMESLTQIRRNALRELKEAAYDLGCNAVIGVDFDYITLDPQTANITGGTTYQPYVFCVTANGNAVIIEKIED